jgi:PPP family 3-phenylpropionic acid transporter
VIGLLWALGVLVEVALFFFAPALLRRFAVARLMTVCLATTALRWVLTALYPDQLPVLVALQATHALGYALLHACTMTRMAALFPGADAGRGQSLLYGFSSGGGGVLGAVVAALLWEWQGGLAAFLGGSALTLMAWAVLRRASR